LQKQGFLAMEETAEDNIQLFHLALTELGQTAKQIRETDGRIMATLLQSTDGFCDLSPAQIVALLSCFVEVRDSDVQCREQTEDPVLQGLYLKMCKMGEAFEKAETEVEEEEGRKDENYHCFEGRQEIILQPYLMSPMMEWATGCTTEEECKHFLQVRIKETMDISLGDFVKIVLKIVAAKKEIEKVAQDCHWLSLLQKLQDVEPMISKFVMTSQSLYLRGTVPVPTCTSGIVSSPPLGET
jgi:hypothetical protein